MVGHTLPHFPILLYRTPLPPLYVIRAHTHSPPVYASPSSKNRISLSLSLSRQSTCPWSIYIRL